MSSAIIGVAGLALSAGAAGYSAYAQNKAAKGAAGNVGAASKLVGKKPVAAEYQPVDFSREQAKTAYGNYKALDNIIPLDTRTNAFIDKDALTRANKLIPNYAANMAIEGNATNDLLNGRLPYDDVLGIVGQRNELGNTLGTPGTSGSATLRDLGVSRLSALQSGAGLLKGMVDIAEQIDPVSRRARPQDMFLSPEDRIRDAMQQNQLIQQSDQNRNNIEAAATPAEALQAQAALSGAGGGGGGGGAGPGYAKAASSLFNGIGQLAAQPSATSPSGTYEGMFATNPVPGVQNRIYRPSTAYSIPV